MYKKWIVPGWRNQDFVKSLFDKWTVNKVGDYEKINSPKFEFQLFTPPTENPSDIEKLPF